MKRVNIPISKNKIVSLLEDIDIALSNYRKDSEISKFNQLESIEPFPVSSIFYEVTEKAMFYGKITDGALDITIFSLSLAWGFGPDWKANAKVPDEKEMSKAVSVTGYWNMEAYENNGVGYLKKRMPGVKIDLSSIAKGYTVDRIADILLAAGFKQYIVNIGGEIRVGNAYPSGKNQTSLWTIAIEKPDSSLDRNVQSTIDLEKTAIATSGVYRNTVNIDGKEYTHLIDPRTAHPVRNHIKSVTIITKTCADADAYATALLVMGKRRAIIFARKMKLAMYMLIEEDGVLKEITSEKFQELSGRGLEK